MKFALFGINTGACAEPDTMLKVATTAEQLGFESVWTGEHVVLPDPQEPPSPAPPLMPMLHPSTALSYIAAATSTLKLGTGITLLAQRNAVVLAKEMASLDYLSKGRLLFGIGAGYLKQEFDALGVNFDERGARTDEYIRAMRELWTSDHPMFAGRFVRYQGIQSRPKPAQAGGPPIIVGGTSAAAYRRAVTSCQGWYGFAMNFETATAALEGLAKAAGTHERAADLGELEISISPRMRMGRDEVARWADMGVTRLILLQGGQSETELVDEVKRFADELM